MLVVCFQERLHDLAIPSCGVLSGQHYTFARYVYGSVSCVFFVQVCLCVISKKHKRDGVYFGLYGQMGGRGGGGGKIRRLQV